MIIKNHGEFILSCDRCSNDVDGFSDWSEVIDFKKQKTNNWGSRKTKEGEWIDLCPDCLGKWNNDKHNINKQIPQKEVSKNFNNPTFKGWELLKRIDENDIKLGQKIKFVVTNENSMVMQNSEETFIYNGMTFVSEKNLIGIEEQIGIITFGISTFEYIV